VRPEDGLDLVADFFLSEWTGIAQRYSKQKGTVEGYVATAFLYYAKRRLAKMQNWRNTLRDTKWLSQLPEREPSEEEQTAAEDLDLLERAVANLPSPLRTALLAYVAGSGRHEEELAERLQITRHRLRSRLADAFGRVSVAIGAATEFLPEDREIILLLWRDGRSVAEVARYLAVPASRVQQTRNRVLERLKRGLLRRRRLKKED
jgi:RNA polymerase sigma factor (sigma-70 family)